MSNTDTIIRAPVNTAGVTDTFRFLKGKPIAVGLYPVASLTSGETADLQRADPAGTFGDVLDFSFGGVVNIDVATNATEVIVETPGSYRLNVANPTNAIGAYIRAVE